MLCDSLRFVRPVTYPERPNHDASVPGWDDKDGGDSYSDSMDSKDGNSAKLVSNGRVGAVVLNTYVDELEAQLVGFFKRDETNCEFLIDVGISMSWLAGNVFKCVVFFCVRLWL